MFRFYINGTLVKDPINWDDFEETIQRDDDLKALLPKYDVKLTFIKDGYALLYGLYRTGGFCQPVDLQVDFKCSGGAWETQLKGIIFLSECEFNLNKCSVSCQIFDNNYGARIFNNKSIKTYLNTGKSKNGESIANATSYNGSVFNADSTYSGTTRDIIYLSDAFRFLVEFMTDGLVGFESTFLDYTLPVSGTTTVRYLAVISGEELRTANGRTPFISFEGLFKEVNKKYPIAFTIIKGSDGRPTVKLENEEYFYGTASGVVISNIDDLLLSTNNERLYSRVLFGGITADFDASIHDFGQVQFLGFKDEEYFLQGECNLDKALDLKAEYIFDTNIIEELVETNTSNESYDDDTFMIEFNHLGVNFALEYPDLTTNTVPMHYNGKQTNNFVAERYSLAGNVALYLGDGSSGFRASKTAQQFIVSHSDPNGGPPANQTSTPLKIIFPDDSTGSNFNADGSYNNALYRYISGQDGDYSFEFSTKIAILGTAVDQGHGICNRSFQIHLQLRKYDGGGILIETNDLQYPSGGSGSFIYVGNSSVFTISTDHLFFLPAGYYCEAWFYLESMQGNFTDTGSRTTASGANVFILDDDGSTFFKTLATTNGGGVYEPKEIGDYYAPLLKFERPLNYADYKTLKQDLSLSVLINNDGSTNKTAWLRRVTRNYTTSNTKFELISSYNENP